MTTLDRTRTDAWADLLERVKDDVGERIEWLTTHDGYTFSELDLYDIAHETADALVPVYTSQIAGLVAAHPSLLTEEPEIGPAEDHWGPAGRWVVAGIYEALHIEALELLDGMS